MKAPLNIILLGDPAAGKATQAKFLISKYKLLDLDMGQEMRHILNGKGSKTLKKSLKETTNKGKLAPTAIVRAIHKEKILKAPKSKGILFDGTPKMIGEAKLVYKWMQQVKRTPENVIALYLHIPEKEVLKRAKNRVEYYKGKFSKRPDDSFDSLKNRVKYYRKNIAQVVTFFKSKYSYKEINGLGTRTEVRKRIDRAITEILKNA